MKHDDDVSGGTRSRTSRPRPAEPPRDLRFEPLRPDRWDDLLEVFGPRGGCAGCWCMVWRLETAEWKRGKARTNRLAFKRLVDSGATPGILAYVQDEPIGWCAVAPRSDYSYLSRSRILQPVDDQPVWSVSCLLVSKPWRRQGVSAALLRAAADFARSRGARVLEGYPVEPHTREMPDVFAWTGTVAAFRRAGFEEVARRSATRPIMRRDLRSAPPDPAAA